MLSPPNNENAVTRWFGPRFAELHPLLQQLHREGGVLEGQVRLSAGRGLAGWLGRRVARGMGIPLDQPERHLQVEIRHEADALLWTRRFEGGAVARSRFTAVGTIENGCWIERSGPLELRLIVDLRDGGWHWRMLGIRAWGLPVPRRLLPQSRAGKWIDDDSHYVFAVAFTLWPLGTLLEYRGALRAVGR